MMLVGFEAVTMFGGNGELKWELDGEGSSMVAVKFY